LRLVVHRLAARDVAGAPAIVARLVAIQAQEKPASYLAIRARAGGVTESGISSVLERFRTVVRTWCLRGTLHLVPAADARWIVRLVAPRVLKSSERRYRQLALDERTLEVATEVICAALEARGALTREEIGDQLETQDISAAGQRLPHLLRRAALLGLICHGPARDDGTETYTLLERWLSLEPPEPEDGWTSVARRYLDAYGPAGVDDFATWSGAYKEDARRAFAILEKELVEVEAQGATLWMPETHTPLLHLAPDHFFPAVRLLPGYDPLLLGYESREWLVAGAFAREIHPGGGLIRPTLLVDGVAAGTWRIDRRRAQHAVVVQPFTIIDDPHRPLLEAEVDDLSRFYEQPLELRVESR
jgi:hypothetical protein